MDEKIPTTYKLTMTARKLIQWLARRRGVNQTALIELIVRDEAKREQAPDAERLPLDIQKNSGKGPKKGVGNGARR